MEPKEMYSQSMSTAEIRQSFIAFIGQNYPQLRSLKIKRGAWHQCEIRARYKNRRLRARKHSIERAIEFFLIEIEEKVLVAN